MGRVRIVILNYNTCQQTLRLDGMSIGLISILTGG